MALLKQTKHIPFNKGFDDKVDDRLAPDGAIKNLENCVFVKNGRIDTTETLKSINDVINDGLIKGIQTVDDENLFVFSKRGVFLKQGDYNFEQIATRNFFDIDSDFIAREEQPIHNPNIAFYQGSYIAAYQIREVPNSSVKYFYVNMHTGKLKLKGELLGARDPIPFSGPRPGILYKDLRDQLKYIFLHRPTDHKYLSVGASNIRFTENDVTDLVKLNEHQFLWVTRVFADDENRLDVHLFNFGSRFPVKSQKIVLSSLGDTRDLGRVFANVNDYDEDRVRICTTLNVGKDNPSVEVYDYSIRANTLQLSFSQHVQNNLHNEIISCVATRTNRLLYGTTQDDIRTGEDALLYDGFALLDAFVINDEEYYLIANETVFAILDGNFRFVLKMNDSHLNNFRDIRRIKVNRGVLCAPYAASDEGSFVQDGSVTRFLGFAVRWFRIFPDRDQDREVERIGNYFLVSGTPISFFDKREVVEYGFVKGPGLRVDSSFSV